MLREIVHYGRMTWNLRAAVRYPFPRDGERALLDQLRNREPRFLEMLLQRLVLLTAFDPLAIGPEDRAPIRLDDDA